MLECKATLRLKSDSLTLEEISNVMGQPSNGFTKGQEFGKAQRLRPHTQWNLEVDLGNSNMQACIADVLDFYNAKDVSDIRTACDVDIFCFVSSDNGQGSFVLDTDVYQKLMDAGLKVTFDFYSD